MANWSSTTTYIYPKYRARWHWNGEDYSLEIENLLNIGVYETVFDMPVNPDDKVVKAFARALGFDIPPLPPTPVSMIDEIDQAIYEFFGYRDAGCLETILSVLETYGVDIHQARVPKQEFLKATKRKR